MKSAEICIEYDNLPTVVVRQHKEDERGNIFTVQKTLIYCGIVVPVGFECDGASVPRFLWPVVFTNDDKQAMFAAIIHDFAYRRHPVGWSKKDADTAFYELMMLGGVPKDRARRAYWGVKLFGCSAWRAGENV